ncbi:MAG: TonB-dependent receptor [Flavobacteriaceae bacterium]|nr:TonB-dependent receptor [Flavobacteriaceae bacterium]MCI5088020.1 TonB-dependent receptor [Flavobacteriaceae bacterium]
MKNLFLMLSLCLAFVGYSQTTVKGTVVDSDSMPVPGANVVIDGKPIGTVTDFDGNFVLETSEVPPFTLKVTSIGFAAATARVTANNQNVQITLESANTLLDEIVISASRTPERLFESPVTVERFGIKEIKNTASVDFYDGLENLKGVDVNTNSLTFKSINTRGFATFANTRFMQLVDGMDNSTPALNFPIGNLVGMIETDVQSVELLPGASSALYGANAFNGILFMRSKNPFDFEGVSVSLKRGVTSQNASGSFGNPENNPYTDVSIRLAKKFSDKFAAKVNVGYLKGTDWVANNITDKRNNGFTRDNLDYDGVNVYGDEVATNIKEVAVALEGMGILPSGANALVPSVVVSRPGYMESDLTNYNAESLKADWGLYYRPFANDFEVAYVGKYGTGNTIYQGTNRYNIKNFMQQQHKIEVRNDNFFVRGYVVSDDAGDSYDMVFTGININRAWKDDSTWFGEYTGAFVQATLGGATQEAAHAAGLATAQTGRFEPGTSEFQAAFDRSVADPNLSTGSRFQDASKYYHADANYNFSHLIDFADIQIGGSFRRYDLNSSGTIYTDSDGPIAYNEAGIYTQIQESFEMSEESSLKLTGSVRYDKSELYDGFFSPRLSAAYFLNRNHNVRFSLQTGFRNPTTQDLFIGLDAGRAILVGSAADNLDRYSRNFEVSASAQNLYGQPASIQQFGRAAYENSYTASSVQALAATGNPAVLEVANPGLVKPEQVTSMEVGYRGKFGAVTLDMSAYYNQYQDFISGENVIAPFYGQVGDNSLSIAAISLGDYQVYQAYTNSEVDVNSYGGSALLTAKVFEKFDLSANYTFTQQDFDKESNPDFMTNFNTPEHKVKASFGSTELVDNFGFNVAWRWSDSYFWEATFGNGEVPSFSTVDAQINYTIPSLKSTLKLGAANLGGYDYFTAFGTGMIGSQYYLSLTINN